MNPETLLCSVAHTSKGAAVSRFSRTCWEQRSFRTLVEQQEPSSATPPLRVEKGLYSSFVFTGTTAVSPGEQLYQSQRLVGAFCFVLRKALLDSKNRMACGLLGTGHISTHLLKTALISYHSPECVVDYIDIVHGLVTEKRAT